VIHGGFDVELRLCLIKICEDILFITSAAGERRRRLLLRERFSTCIKQHDYAAKSVPLFTIGTSDGCIQSRLTSTSEDLCST